MPFVLNNHGILINSSGLLPAMAFLLQILSVLIMEDIIRIIQTRKCRYRFRNSTAVGTELGEFEFDSPGASDIPALNGANYGSLILSSVAAGGSKTYIGGGAAACNVRGNFNLNTGVTFSISMSANFI